MKIGFIQISNVLSFRFHERIENAEIIEFDSGLNIVIGENGAGKSTALEVINFFFRRVIYTQFTTNHELLSNRAILDDSGRRQILQKANHQSYNDFRLDPNWDTEDKPQRIRIRIDLDDIDERNIFNIKQSLPLVRELGSSYSMHAVEDGIHERSSFIIDIVLDKSNQRFTIETPNGNEDFGFKYLTDYNYFKELITIYNFINPDNRIPPLFESFTLISSFRNYHAFQPAVSLREQEPSHQIRDIKNREYSKSLNASDQSEPTIFGLVRLLIAEIHFRLIRGQLSEHECEVAANQAEFLVSINNRLRIVNMECKIRLIDLRTWSYSFEFLDLRRGKAISNINSLSAGQKAIVHLVFEAYGRGDLKGGVVIIDEPEIHLHYQFQHEYLRVIDELNRDQNCQYILVTHSEALINSSTISSVRRFSLSSSGHTKVFSPALNTDQKSLIRVLDNARSTYAFFAKKVLLVEGDTDRFFFREIIISEHRNSDQEIAVLHMGGKKGYSVWKNLFSQFGLTVYCVADFDFIIDVHYRVESGKSLKSSDEIQAFKQIHEDWESKIEASYESNLFILKLGDLEHYLGIRKGLEFTIQFCDESLQSFLFDSESERSKEINFIMRKILG